MQRKFYLISVITLCVSLSSCQSTGNDAVEINNLIERFNNRDALIREKACDELSQYRNSAVSILLSFIIKSEDNRFRKEGILCLGKIRTKEAATALLTFFKQTHDFFNETSDALLDIGKPAIEPLFNSYSEQDHEVRLLGLSTLNNFTLKYSDDRNINDQIKKQFVKAFKQDSILDIRIATIFFLQQYIFDDEIRNLMEGALNDENKDIRKAAAQVLGDEK